MLSSSGYLGLGFVKGVSVKSGRLSDRSLQRLTTAFRGGGNLEQTHPCPLPSSKKLRQSCCCFYYRKGDTMRPSLLGSRFYCVTVAMETKWGQDNDKIAFGKFCTDWTGIVDIYLE